MPEDAESNVIDFPEQPRQKQSFDDGIATALTLTCGTDDDGIFKFRLVEESLGLDMRLEEDGAIAAMAVFVSAMRGIRDLWEATREPDPPPVIMAANPRGSA